MKHVFMRLFAVSLILAILAGALAGCSLGDDPSLRYKKDGTIVLLDDYSDDQYVAQIVEISDDFATGKTTIFIQGSEDFNVGYQYVPFDIQTGKVHAEFYYRVGAYMIGEDGKRYDPVFSYATLESEDSSCVLFCFDSDKAYEALNVYYISRNINYPTGPCENGSVTVPHKKVKAF